MPKVCCGKVKSDQSREGKDLVKNFVCEWLEKHLGPLHVKYLHLLYVVLVQIVVAALEPHQKNY